MRLNWQLKMKLSLTVVFLCWIVFPVQSKYWIFCDMYSLFNFHQWLSVLHFFHVRLTRTSTSSMNKHTKNQKRKIIAQTRAMVFLCERWREQGWLWGTRTYGLCWRMRRRCSTLTGRGNLRLRGAGGGVEVMAACARWMRWPGGVCQEEVGRGSGGGAGGRGVPMWSAAAARVWFPDLLPSSLSPLFFQWY